MASSLITQPSARALAISAAVTSVIPSRYTSVGPDLGMEGEAGQDGGLGGGVEALTSAVGSASA